MAALDLPFAAQVGNSGVRQNSQEVLINMFAEVEQSGRSRLVRRPRVGLRSVTANTGVKRCIERNGAFHYAVIDDKLYRYDGSSLTELGTVSNNSRRCTMVFNDNGDIMVSDGLQGYVYNGTTVSLITAPTQIGPVAFQGGYGIYSVPGTDQFYVTDLNDFATISALSFATAESKPDPLVRAFVDHNELWLFGVRTTEVWQLSGGTDFPFARFTNAQLERGCSAAYSVAAEDNTVYWLGDDGIVYRADGYRPVRVSTHAVERMIQDVSSAAKAAADAFVYTMSGHKFYTLTFPGELTVQFNIATGFWNTCRTYGSDSWNVLGSAGHSADYYLTDAGIVALDDDIAADEGGIMEQGGISAPLYANGRRITLGSFFLDAEVGRAAINQEARVSLRVARDGETFGNERWRSLGSTGQYKRRAMWRNLGQGRNIAIEFMMTDPTPLRIMGASGEVSVGSS